MSAPGNNKVYAYVWFDVEDYVSPASNDVPLQAINILKKYNVPITMKLVAEKVRFMKEQNRQDVISAIQEYCDVGYHTDSHSRHPMVFEYIGNKDVAKGAEEIEKREQIGLQELQTTFGKTPSCFGHAGTQWAPHYYPFLKKSGIPVYLDATDVVNIDDSPYWYCGVLSLNNQTRNMIKFDRSFETPEGNQKLKEKFESIYNRLSKKRGGGAISILWHPHTGINKVYWDALNFSGGKNTPKEKYIIPEQYPTEIKERAIRDFEELISFASSFPGVKFITGTDAPKVYSRNPERELSIGEIRKIATKITGSNKISFFKLGDEYLSPSQAFCALVNFLAGYSKSKKLPERTAMSEPLGPMAPFASKVKSSKLPLSRLLVVCGRASKFIADRGYMPSSLKIGEVAELSPSDFLATIATVAKSLSTEKKVAGETVPVRRAHMILEEKYVDEKAFKTACEWGILPKGFKAPKILEQAKLQTWTLVPAESRN
jgi:hypothetical protein